MIREQDFPAYVVGISKLKIVEVLLEMVAKSWVPAAVFGLSEETGAIRCGYW